MRHSTPSTNSRFGTVRRTSPSKGIRPTPHRPEPATWEPDRLTAAWLGHSTVLLNLFGTWFLTDPALRPRIGVDLWLTALGPRRHIAPALEPQELPALHTVLISHAHMDHLDLGTLRRLPKATRVIAHRGLADLLGRFHEVVELEWGEHTDVNGVRVEAIPAEHWGARRMTDTHRGYGGFLIEGRGRRVVFTGDTAGTDRYQEVGRRGPADLAIVPIGAYDPWIRAHASPEQAWAIARDLRARHVLPVHHSTFRLSREPMEEPIQRFLTAAGSERDRVVVTEVGQTAVLPTL